MRSRDVLNALLGGAVIYIVMAACSGSNAKTDGPNGQAGFGGVEGGPSGGTGSGSLDASRDALGFDSPVRDAKAEQNSSGSRLKARWYVGSDGAKQFAGWFDAQLQVNCDFYTLAADGKRRCLPTTTVGAIGYFTDGGCGSPLLVSPKGCTASKHATATIAGATCPYEQRYQVHRVGTAIPASATIYTKGSGSSCTPLTNSLGASSDTFASAGVVAPTDFVEAAEQHD